MKREWWLIDIENYGEYAFYGTEEEAEEERAGKAEWEGERGTKTRIGPTNPKVLDSLIRWKKDQARGVTLEPNQKEAVQKFTKTVLCFDGEEYELK